MKETATAKTKTITKGETTIANIEDNNKFFPVFRSIKRTQFVTRGNNYH